MGIVVELVLKKIFLRYSSKEVFFKKIFDENREIFFEVFFKKFNLVKRIGIYYM